MRTSATRSTPGHARKQLALSLTAAAACAACGAAWAQSAAPANNAELQVIQVTAQKTVENPQKIPLAVTALSGDSLAEGGVRNLLNLQGLVTSVNVIDQGPGASIQIRGVGSNPGGGNVDPSAAFSVDGVYQSRSGGAFGAMYDLARVEVLKGPQGTLYGRNATVGAVNAISNEPGRVFEGLGELEVGNYSLRRGSVMLNAPINDTLQLRVAAQIVKHDGYLSDGYNDADDKAARVRLMVRPTKSASILLTADTHSKGGNGQGNIFTGTVATTPQIGTTGLVGVGVQFQQTHTPMRDDPSDPWRLTTNSLTAANVNATSASATGHAEPANAGLKMRNSGFTAEYRQELDGMSLTVLPSVRTSYVLNQGGTGGNFIQPAYSLVDQKQTSMEFRLNSAAGGNLRWIAGLFFLDEDAPTLTIARAQTGANTTFTNMTQVHAESGAVFGQITYAVRPGLRLTAGLRATSDLKSQAGSIYQVNGATLDTSATNYTATGAPISADGSYRSSSTNYKIGLDTDLGASTMAYVNWSTGYKAGGLNFDGAGGARQTFDPETLGALSAGFKHRGMNNRLQLNMEVYHWRYRNQQYAVLDQLDAPNALRGSAFSNLLFRNNTGTSTISGVDMDLAFKLSAADTLTASVAYMRARNGSFVTPQTTSGQFPIGPGVFAAAPFQASVDLTGKTMPFAPTWQANLGYSHVFDIGGGATLTASTDWHVQTESYVNYNLFSPERQPGYGRGNVSLVYTSAGGALSVQSWVRNVTNTPVLTRGSVLGSVGGTIAHYAGIGDPRTYGVTVGYRF